MQYGDSYSTILSAGLIFMGDLLEIGADGLRFWICLPSHCADDPIVALRVWLLGRFGYSSNFSVSSLDK